MTVNAKPLHEPTFEPDADYVESPNLATACERLIRRHPRFTDLAGLRIAYLERLGDPSGDGEEAAAKCVKASALWRDVAGVDAAIWVWRHIWTKLAPRAAEALSAHELTHLSVTEKGTVKLVKHDVEDFSWVVREYGPWNEQLRVFAEQLRAFDDEPTPLKPRGQ